jgi:hypothetical protein
MGLLLWARPLLIIGNLLADVVLALPIRAS